MKKIILFALIAVILLLGFSLFLGASPRLSSERINEASNYSKTNGLSTDYCIFVDYSAYSGSKRLMLYSFEENKILFSCKCAHGNDGSEKMEATEQSFSNKIGSHKSSLGKYKIGKKRKIKKREDKNY